MPKPKFVNRGPAGLLIKLKGSPAGIEPALTEGGEVTSAKPPVAAKHNYISAPIKHLAVGVETLTPDPENARLHPERNMEAIRESLRLYGQMKPIVVRKQTMVVVAGNGTLAAAKQLGWTKIAANVVTMTDAEAIGYGLADNRTAELAAWDEEALSRLMRLSAEMGNERPPGWSPDELAVLRATGWVDPPAEFPEVDENIEIEHQCPKCGYRFSGGSVKEGIGR